MKNKFFLIFGNLIKNKLKNNFFSNLLKNKYQI
jgi:hypothetical protein